MVICGSMAFYSNMLEHKRILQNAGINTLIPDSDNDLINSLQETDFQKIKRRASMKHIRRIRDQKTFGILVLNYDKHGISDYIGANTFAEIAIAVAHYKRIYLFQGLPDFYREELLAWQVVCLNGSLKSLIRDCKEASILENIQPKLF